MHGPCMDMMDEYNEYVVRRQGYHSVAPLDKGLATLRASEIHKLFAISYVVVI